MTPPPPRYPFGIGAVLEGITTGGWCGVDLFFVLSGFLVSGLLFVEYQRLGSISFRRFFIRRGLKIYPAFYAMLAVCILFEERTTRAVTLPKVFSEIFFLQDYAPHIFNHTWSLAVEEQFYIVIGVLAATLSARNAMRWLPVLCVLTFPACLLMRLASYAPGGEGAAFYQGHTRADSLALGVLISYLFHFHPATFAALRRSRFALVAAGLIAVVPVFTLGGPDQGEYLPTLGLTVNYLAFGAFVAVAAMPRVGGAPGRLARALAALGSYSYSIYLWHMFVKRALSYLRKTGWFELPYPLELALYVAASLAVGVAMAKLVEMPVLRVRDRYWPGHGAALDD